ncbi:MAG: VOC family protein [Pseudomonadota bacterium]
MAKFVPHHIHLMSHDAMAAAAFYEQMFGADVEASKGANGLPRANMRLGGQLILISTVDATVTQTAAGPHSCLGLDHIGIAVDDLASAAAQLESQGAQFTMAPRGRIAFIKGPDDVSIELVEAPAG